MKNTSNPGCVDPANQAYPPPPMAKPAQGTSRNLPTTSNGEIQPRCPANTLSSPATSIGSCAVTQSTGEQQFKDLRPPEISVSTCKGLPTNVNAGSARPRGLPTDVVIK